MSRSNEVTKCMEQVCQQLQKVGVDKIAAKDTVIVHMPFFYKITEITYSLESSSRQLLATVVLLEMMLTKTHKPHYSLYLTRNNLFAHLQEHLMQVKEKGLLTEVYCIAMQQLAGKKDLSSDELTRQLLA